MRIFVVVVVSAVLIALVAYLVLVPEALERRSRPMDSGVQVLRESGVKVWSVQNPRYRGAALAFSFEAPCRLGESVSFMFSKRMENTLFAHGIEIVLKRRVLRIVGRVRFRPRDVRLVARSLRVLFRSAKRLPLPSKNWTPRVRALGHLFPACVYHDRVSGRPPSPFVKRDLQVVVVSSLSEAKVRHLIARSFGTLPDGGGEVAKREILWPNGVRWERLGGVGSTVFVLFQGPLSPISSNEIPSLRALRFFWGNARIGVLARRLERRHVDVKNLETRIISLGDGRYALQGSFRVARGAYGRGLKVLYSSWRRIRSLRFDSAEAGRVWTMMRERMKISMATPTALALKLLLWRLRGYGAGEVGQAWREVSISTVRRLAHTWFGPMSLVALEG